MAIHAHRSSCGAALVALLGLCVAAAPPQASTRPARAAQQPSSRPAAATAPASTQPLAEGAKVVKPFEGVTVIIDKNTPAESRVEVESMTCLDAGWLEQVACGPASREHESLVVVRPKPSQIHAALLMAGFEPGKPGHWTYENQKFSAVNPTGDKVAVLVRYADKAGKTVEHDISKWIRQPGTEHTEPKPFPHEPWVFGGSILERNNPDLGPGEHYIADLSGSIIGLVTFGDEMIGFSRVLSDQESVQEPVWEANTEALPPVGTPVALIIRKWKE